MILLFPFCNKRDTYFNFIRGLAGGEVCWEILSSKYRILRVNLFKPDFTIVIFIHYKPRIAAAILDL